MERFTKDVKRDYLIRTFSRTRKKDYENYVLNTIWTKLNRLDLKPVTQQFVKFEDGSFALIDLYFPQINYAIECDEFYHAHNRHNDLKRKMKIEDVLNSIKKTDSFVMQRVKAYQSIESIHVQIDNIVNEIEGIINNMKEFYPWEILNAKELRKTISMISIDDRITYSRIVDIAHMLGRDVKQMQHGYFPVRDEYYAWCPQLAVMVNNELISSGKHGWINYLSEDWNYIYETKKEKKEMQSLDKQSHKLRITFVRSKDIFNKQQLRFIGVFEFDKVKSTTNRRVYKKISDVFKL